MMDPYHPIRHTNGMDSPVSPNRACSVELDLPRFRKRAGVSLQQIAERTKISTRFLEAIEKEQFDQLPGGIFSTSYLRQYAEAIGYEEDALLAFYNQKMNPAPPAPKGAQAETSGRRLLDRWLRTATQAPR
jgi:cytoskeletal protein RodZ